jgi:hypothetical protein
VVEVGHFHRAHWFPILDSPFAHLLRFVSKGGGVTASEPPIDPSEEPESAGGPTEDIASPSLSRPAQTTSAPGTVDPRFDPYTGELLRSEQETPLVPRFDPYTGKPLNPSEEKRNNKKLWIIGFSSALAAGVIVLIVFLLRSGGTGLIPHAGHELTVTLDLTNSSDSTTGNVGGCAVSGTGYEDLSAGAPVTIRDARGTVLGATTLPGGTDDGDVCHFETKVHVPDTSFYQVEVSHRGVVTFTRQDLAENNWIAGLTVGS